MRSGINSVSTMAKPAYTAPATKYGGKIVVCQPGSWATAKSIETIEWTESTSGVATRNVAASVNKTKEKASSITSIPSRSQAPSIASLIGLSAGWMGRGNHAGGFLGNPSGHRFNKEVGLGAILAEEGHVCLLGFVDSAECEVGFAAIFDGFREPWFHLQRAIIILQGLGVVERDVGDEVADHRQIAVVPVQCRIAGGHAIHQGQGLEVDRQFDEIDSGISGRVADVVLRAEPALREPALGPVFGVKGGACGGYSQVLPMEEPPWRTAADSVPILLAPAHGRVVSLHEPLGWRFDPQSSMQINLAGTIPGWTTDMPYMWH